MKAICGSVTNELRVENVPHPHLVNPHDAIIQVTLIKAG
jgi:hypothetical protein